MIFRLNLFLWLHLIPRKFHFQFQSNPDDKYQPAPFHRKWKISVSILFFCFGDYGELGNGMFCQNANDFWWVKKSKIMIFFWRGFGRKSLSSGCFTWKRWELYQVNFKLAEYSLLFVILQISTIYPILRS